MKIGIAKTCLVWIILSSDLFCSAQSVTEPSKIKQFNITVNYDDYTVKTQMLSHPKKIETKSELTYMWYASQKIMETKGGFDGKLIHGFYNSFYLNNQLKEQGSIRYGLKHKTWKYWYPDGRLRELITWKNGVKNGEYCIYNDVGQIMAKGNFKNDKLNGKFMTFGPNGIITEKKKYKDGVEIIPKPTIERVKPPKEPKEKKPKKEKKSKNKSTDTKQDPKVVQS
jgi:hypothetical protein